MRLLDLGHAKHLESSAGHTSTLCGSPEYMAPEEVGGSRYGLARDWWAVGGPPCRR